MRCNHAWVLRPRSSHNKHPVVHAVGIDIGSGDPATAIVVLGQQLNDTCTSIRRSSGSSPRKQEPVQSDIVDVQVKFVRAGVRAAELVLRLRRRGRKAVHDDVVKARPRLPAHRGREED